VSDTQRREMARDLVSLADKAVAMAGHEPGSSMGDLLDGSIYDMYRAMAGGHYAKAIKVALEILSNVGLTTG
jgi:hypothetical protein